MSPRPPTLREKRRYILARIEPAGITVDQKDLYYAISDAVTSLWGDSTAAAVTAAVVAVEGSYVFVRCVRGTERELMIALSTVTGCRDAKLALRIVAASGTMESLRERIRRRNPPVPSQVPSPAASPGEQPEISPEPLPASPVNTPPAGVSTGDSSGVSFAGKKFIPLECEGGKVDVIEKGIKNANRLFLLTEDLEVS